VANAGNTSGYCPSASRHVKFPGRPSVPPDCCLRRPATSQVERGALALCTLRKTCRKPPAWRHATCRLRAVWRFFRYATHAAGGVLERAPGVDRLRLRYRIAAVITISNRSARDLLRRTHATDELGPWTPVFHRQNRGALERAKSRSARSADDRTWGFGRRAPACGTSNRTRTVRIRASGTAGRFLFRRPKKLPGRTVISWQLRAGRRACLLSGAAGP